MSKVFPGVADVLANFLLFVNILIRLDFPTFDLPMKAYSGLLSLGHIDSMGALRVNSAFFISIFLYFGCKGTNKRVKCQIYLSIFERKYLRRSQNYKNILELFGDFRIIP